MNIRLEDKVALVTGASRGIGSGIALMLGQCGATVIGTATTQTGADRIEQMFRDHDIKGSAGVLDVSNSDSITAFFSRLSAENLVPLILVNNAGITRDNLMLRMKDEEWLDVIETNLNSVFRVTRQCLKGMVKARYGRIINITSVSGLSGNAGQANYSAAKAGMIGFTKSLARELGSRGITVNAVAPGFIVTDMTAELPAEHREMMSKQTALGRFGEVTEVAGTVTFLASDLAGYITGETINVNGGLYMA